MKSFLLVLLCASAIVASVNGGPTREKHRRGPKDLSDETHYDPETEEHNTDYDHEAFLGKEEADEMMNLSPQEQKRRLKIIFGKIDINSDGHVDHDELKAWVGHIAAKHIMESTDMQMGDYDLDKNGKITLSEYHNVTFGKIEEEDAEYDPHRKLSFKDMKARDTRKFEAADVNKDGSLDRQEFSSFLHPEEVPHMRVVVIEEALQDMDKDRDGFVTLEEYIEDIWPKHEREESEAEPDWVKSERDQFLQHRDQDKNNKLDKRELGEWIAPEGHDNPEAEARHLIFNADKNKDGKLTEEEMLENEELFIGSQATDFGSYMYRHDEF